MSFYTWMIARYLDNAGDTGMVARNLLYFGPFGNNEAEQIENRLKPEYRDEYKRCWSDYCDWYNIWMR